MLMKTSNKFAMMILIAACVSVTASGWSYNECCRFSKVIETAKCHYGVQQQSDMILEQKGYVSPHNVFGDRSNDQCIAARVQQARIHTLGAQIFKNKYDERPDEFQSIATKCNKLSSNGSVDKCIKDLNQSTKIHAKYRSVDGRGNNAVNPNWGASAMPFQRFGSKNYEDGIYSIKKSVVDGSDLPNARLIAQEVLAKAIRSSPPPARLNTFGLLAILFATHDLHYQIPMQPKDADKEILCCTENRKHVADNSSSNSACFAIEVTKDDLVLKDDGIGCMNMVRSQIGDHPGKVEPGEILNHATAFLDLSLIYGNSESELKKVRLYKGGKLRLGKNNLLPVDVNGKYIKSMDRFLAVPIASIWPSLFSRNHNHLAERLAILNPHWNEETLFQETRRINIANLQYILIGSKGVESVFGRPIKEKYSVARNPETFLEFASSYRTGHYYMQSHMVFEDEKYVQTKRILHSDTIGNVDVLVNNFNDALRAAINQPINVGLYSDEIMNRIGKDKPNGYGIDLIATDIQRGRDHGMSSYAEIRKKCNVTPEVHNFDDLTRIFNKTNVELLKKFYKSFDDVDLYVGGLMEMFEYVASPLAGPTFGCVIGANYANAVGGDIYYYTHPESPYPMTTAQIAAINKFEVPNLICTNSGLKETSKLWAIQPLASNPKIGCEKFPPMDLSAWTESVDIKN